MDEREIGLAHLATGKHLAESEMGGVVAGDDDEAAGLLVEAVDDAGTQWASGGRKLLVMIEESVDKCTRDCGRRRLPRSRRGPSFRRVC